MNKEWCGIKFACFPQADATLLDPEGKTCLHYAASCSTQTAVECVQHVVKRNKQILDVKVATYEIHTPFILKSSLEGTFGGVPNIAMSSLVSQDSLGCVPLHWCAVSGTVDTLEFLHSSGCALDVLDTSERSVVHLAAGRIGPRTRGHILVTYE